MGAMAAHEWNRHPPEIQAGKEIEHSSPSCEAYEEALMFVVFWGFFSLKESRAAFTKHQ